MSFFVVDSKNWTKEFSMKEKRSFLRALESGKVMFFPAMGYDIKNREKEIFDPHLQKMGVKNISRSPLGRVKGLNHLCNYDTIDSVLEDFSKNAYMLISNLFPSYQNHLIQGRTSFRPIEISGRQTSLIEDDKRIHVDAFSSFPVAGYRILRVFCNINPTQPRFWYLGEPFEKIAFRFVPHLKKPFWGKASLLKILGLTKTYRTLYDHYMLGLHDAMKKDEVYQNSVSRELAPFPAGSAWIAFTDFVSHAAISGQFVLEQTFYLPVRAMERFTQSPLYILQSLIKTDLLKYSPFNLKRKK